MSSATCFTKFLRDGGQITTEVSPARACGASNNPDAHFTCCWPGDSCLDDNICHYTHARANGTGYYISGCTDPTWTDPSCSNHCTSEFFPDITYNFTTQQWACCTSGTNGLLHCDKPTSDTWQAPPPVQLEQIASIPASATASGWRPSDSAGSAAQVTAPAAAAASTALPPDMVGLGSAAKIGIGVGVGLGVAVGLAVIGFVLCLRRRRQKQKMEQPPPKYEWSGHGDYYAPQPNEASRDRRRTLKAEMPPDHATIPEMPGSLDIAELENPHEVE